MMRARYVVGGPRTKRKVQAKSFEEARDARANGDRLVTISPWSLY